MQLNQLAKRFDVVEIIGDIDPGERLVSRTENCGSRQRRSPERGEDADEPV